MASKSRPPISEEDMNTIVDRIFRDDLREMSFDLDHFSDRLSAVEDQLAKQQGAEQVKAMEEFHGARREAEKE